MSEWISQRGKDLQLLYLLQKLLLEWQRILDEKTAERDDLRRQLREIEEKETR